MLQLLLDKISAARASANPTSILLDLKVTPKSRQNQIIDCFEQLNGHLLLQLKIHGIPEKGQVNQEIIEYLSRELNLPKSNLRLIAGLTSRRKILQITLSLPQ